MQCNVIAKLRARRDGDERGFTLIELMVVVLIIAILIAIAIPTFLGARQRAQDKAAQSSLRNALTAAKTIYTDSEDYTQTVPSAGEHGTRGHGAEPHVRRRRDGVDRSEGGLGGQHRATNLIVMASQSKSGKCFWMRDNTQGPGTEFASDHVGTCDAAARRPRRTASTDGFRTAGKPTAG